MKRNWYAVVILLMLCLLLLAAGRYVDRTTAALVQQVHAAYARRAYGRAAEKARESSVLLNLLVRRNILDQMNQTMAVLPPCAETDSLADLEMETQRACTQIEQVRQSFFGGL